MIYGFSASTGSYKRAVIDFGSGYRQRDRNGDGVVELFAGDYRFKYKFSCGACSPQPLTIWRYRRFALEDASRSFPGALRDHARRMHRLYRRARPESALVKGILPAYAADMCRIQRCPHAFRLVQRARRRGELALTVRTTSRPSIGPTSGRSSGSCAELAICTDPLVRLADRFAPETRRTSDRDPACRESG